MKCINCNTINEEDAIFCKKCGYSLLDDNNIKNNSKDNKKQKAKTKVKTKTKTKIKKVKSKSKKNKSNNKTIERRMSFGQKLLMFFMVIIILVLLCVCGVAGYYYYSEQNISVPNVTGLTYQDAELKLAQSSLKAEKVLKEVNDEELDGIVTNQSKQGGKAYKDAKIRVTVGVMKKYNLPSFIGSNIDKAKNTLNHNNIKYKINYKEVTSGEDGIVLSQSPSKSTLITTNQIVNLVVSKKIEKEENTSNETQTNDTENDSTTNSSSEEENE